MQEPKCEVMETMAVGWELGSIWKMIRRNFRGLDEEYLQIKQMQTAKMTEVSHLSNYSSQVSAIKVHVTSTLIISEPYNNKHFFITYGSAG